MLKKYFITGIVILLPVALTLMIVSFFFNLLTEPFIGIVNAVFDHYGILKHDFAIVSAYQIRKFLSQIIVLAILFLFTVGLGLLARWFFFHYLVRLWEYIVSRIPFVSNIYTTCQDVIQTFFTSNANSFKQVVLVPFPNKKALSIGLVTRDNIRLPDGNDHEIIAVFVPTTPNPTSGFLVMFKKEDLIYLDMKVEDAFKYVISCGMIATPFVPK